jgi:hypothetical protein
MTQNDARIIHLDPRQLQAVPALKVYTQPPEGRAEWADPETDRIRQRARQIAQAMQFWTGQLAPISEADLTRHLPALEASIRDTPGLWAETRVAHIRDALRGLHGDARLIHPALMTPQEILTLPRVGMSGLQRLIQELQRETPLSIPELVTGTGKATLERVPADSAEIHHIRMIPSSSRGFNYLRVC